MFGRWIALVVLVVTSLERTTGHAAVQLPSSQNQTLVGKLLLPDGKGNRGVEVIATIVTADKKVRQEWMQLDDDNRFEFSFTGELAKFADRCGRTIRQILALFQCQTVGQG